MTSCNCHEQSLPPDFSLGLAGTSLSRRQLLRQAACGFGELALLGLLAAPTAGAKLPHRGANPLSPKLPHFAPRVRRVIFLFMQGGVSHIDTFDPKPKLNAMDGQPLPFEKPLGFNRNDRKDVFLMRSPWSFAKYGQSGIEVSELFPRIAACVDDLCVVRSMSHDLVDHGQASLELHTGDGIFVRPSMGSWILYGLGTENLDLPGFISICPSDGVRSFSSAFLPAVYQGTRLGEATGRGRPDDAQRAKFTNMRRAHPNAALQRMQLDLVQARNAEYGASAPGVGELEARIQSLELAFRMQTAAPTITDLSDETAETLALYGIGREPTDNFGRQCLLARRFAERGVRFIQATHAVRWDQHSRLRTGHAAAAAEVDRPISALLADLKTRGLWDDTLVVWGTEFGRTPVAQSDDNENGRDHNPYGFTIWMSGGGVRTGTVYGATDEFGYFAVENKLDVHDLHATILHLLGCDHTQLTYEYAGRDFRLTDVAGRVISDLLA
jgi:hypothetical protein